MAILEININPDFLDQTISLSLDGIAFNMRAVWNERQAAWSISLLDDTGNAIASGVKMEPDTVPFRNIVREGMPPGNFVCVDTSGAGLPPARDEFGFRRRVRLHYIEAS